MTNFSDQLFTDLMREHEATLQHTAFPVSSARHANIKRGAWLAGGAGTLAVGVTAGLAAFGGGAAQAYAVTPNPDGTVTVSISDLSGVNGANAKLQQLGDRVVLVPVRAGCPSISSLRNPAVMPGQSSGSVTASKGSDTITIAAHGIPQSDLMVLAIQQTGGGIHIAGRLSAPPAPACLSIPPGQHNHGTSGSSEGPGTTQQVKTGSGQGPALSPSAG